MEPTKTINSPIPLEVSYRYLRLLVPSKMTPTEPRTIQYYPSGKHHCGCPGWMWNRRLGKHDSKCRHHKMTTIKTGPSDTLKELLYSFKLLSNRAKKMYVSWGFVSCQFPQHRDEGAVHCTGCIMYPEYCNVHPIYFGKRSNSKPLIWKLQTAIYNGRRKDALQLMRNFVKVVRAIRSGDD